MVIRYQRLGSEETQALVQAMESRVEWVELGGKVTLDIRDLMKYSGQGKCSRVECGRDTAGRYRKQLKTWARSRFWKVTCDDDYQFIIVRMSDTEVEEVRQRLDREQAESDERERELKQLLFFAVIMLLIAIVYMNFQPFILTLFGTRDV